MFGHCQKLHSLSNWHDCRSLSSHVVPIFRGLAPPPAARAPALDRSLPDRPAFRALLLNAAGTLIFPSEPVSKVYHRYGARYGCSRSEDDVRSGFGRAFNAPWAKTTSRYVGDGRPFWQFIVQEATGCSSSALVEDLYTFYGQPQAWAVMPGAVDALYLLRSAGVKLGLVSNFDTRLRPLLQAMHLASLFDTIVISAEEGYEKPNPVLFERACVRLGVATPEAVHVGDDRRNDVTGARLAGCSARLWGSDVNNFSDVTEHVLHGCEPDV